MTLEDRWELRRDDDSWGLFEGKRLHAEARISVKTQRECAFDALAAELHIIVTAVLFILLISVII